MYKFNRLNDLQKNIKSQVKALGENEEKFLGKSLYENFKDVHQETAQFIDKNNALKIDWSYIDDKFIESAINQNWQGGNFSSRVWDNKDKLIKELNKTIIDGIASGRSINDMAADLKYAMGTGAFEALRLARTETMHTINQAQTESFQKAGYCKVIWIAAADEITCEECGSMDGQSFNIEEAPDCPAHPNCRCTLAADPDSLDIGKSDDNVDNEANALQQLDNNVKSSENIDSNNENSAIMDTEESIKNNIKNGKYPLTINVQAQSKHIQESDQYIEGRSIVTISIDEVQELVNEYAGTGTPIVIDGEWKNKERIIDNDKIIGVQKDKDGKSLETSNFMIHYNYSDKEQKRGTHIVPSKP